MEDKKKKQQEDEEREEGKELCPDCGNIMIDDSGEKICSSCSEVIDFLGDEEEKDENDKENK